MNWWIGYLAWSPFFEQCTLYSIQQAVKYETNQREAETRDGQMGHWVCGARHPEYTMESMASILRDRYTINCSSNSSCEWYYAKVNQPGVVHWCTGTIEGSRGRGCKNNHTIHSVQTFWGYMIYTTIITFSSCLSVWLPPNLSNSVISIILSLYLSLYQCP